MTNKLTIAQLLQAAEIDVVGGYGDDGFESGVWYDWFCKSESLVNRGRVLVKRLKGIAASTKIDIDKTYVFFKNNCPCYGSLYDSFSICNIDSGDVIYWVTPKSGHSGLAEVYGAENGFKDPLIAGSWKEVKEWFNK